MDSDTESKTLRKKVIGSRFFVWGGVIVLVLIIVGLGKAALKKHDIQQEIRALYDNVESLESENTELAGLLEYFKTKNFEERQAREMLGMKKSGETVVAIPESRAEDDPVFQDNVGQGAQESSSNPRKWWNYFFSIQL